jgi:DNA-binding transcriptional regulator YhcF (GntR family)
MDKLNGKGRSKKRARFFPVLHHVTESFAWSQLSPISRAAYVEIGLLFNGSNNGKLGMSSRQLGGRLKVSQQTAWRAIAQLITFGFVERSRASSFSSKRRAAEYRLTHMTCDRTGELPTNAYEKITHAGASKKEPANVITLNPNRIP